METAFLITFCLMFTLLFFRVGGIIGWIYREHRLNMYPEFSGALHPEMFDQNGNLLPDEILAVRFENDYDYEDEED